MDGDSDLAETVRRVLDDSQRLREMTDKLNKQTRELLDSQKAARQLKPKLP